MAVGDAGSRGSEGEWAFALRGLTQIAQITQMSCTPWISQIFGAADIFRGLDVSLIHWLQIRSWLGMALLKGNSFLNQNQKNLFVSTPRAKALFHFRFEGL